MKHEASRITVEMALPNYVALVVTLSHLHLFSNDQPRYGLTTERGDFCQLTPTCLHHDLFSLPS